MSEGYRERNDTSRQRLRDVVARLDDAAMERQIDDDWTVAAALAHLAFWDESCVQRWNQFDHSGAFPSLPGDIVGLINAANLPAWRALPPAAVRELVLRAAEAADARTASLPPAALAYVTETGKEFILERASHREEHIDQIEEILG